MTKDKRKTSVVFLIHNTDNQHSDLFAFFPKIVEQNSVYMCYARNGQHSPCHIDYARESRLATPEEYDPLREELESLGYNLNILSKL